MCHPHMPLFLRFYFIVHYNPFMPDLSQGQSEDNAERQPTTFPMITSLDEDAWERLETLVDQDDAYALADFFQMLPPGDIAYAVHHLDSDRRPRLLSQLASVDVEIAADIFEHLADEQSATLIEELPPREAAAIVEELPSDDQTDIISELDEDDADAILAEMSPNEAAEVRKRLVYDPDTAGGLMIAEYLAFPDTTEVGGVIRALRQIVDEGEGYEARYLFVTDQAEKLVGLITMRSLILSPTHQSVSEIMRTDYTAVPADTSLDDLEDIFDRHDYAVVPVIDHDGALLGVIQHVAVEEALNERSEEASLRRSGIVGGEEIRSMPIGARVARRLMFLMPILVLLMISASMIALFEETVGKLPILAAFLPVVAGLAGSGGTQAVAVTMRELTLGIIKPRDFFLVLWQEVSVGFINGLTLGICLGGIVFVWQNNLLLAAILAISLPITICVSVAVGGAVPLIVKRFGVDPAMIAGPLVTTVVDVCAFVTVLALATMAIQ